MKPATSINRKLRDLTRTILDRKAALRTQQPIIGYIGWMGHGNLGDDAMWQAACNTLDGVTLVAYDAPQRERLLARVGLSGPQYFQSVVLGGGTLISPRFFPPIVATALAQNIPLWSWGTGVGSSGFEMDQTVDLSAWKPMLSRFKSLGVRGPHSQSSLLEMGGIRPKIVGDLALSLSRSYVQAAEKKFAVNLSLPPGEAYEDSGKFTFVEAPLLKLVEEGWNPIPIAMTESDLGPTAALLEKIISSPPDVLLPKTAEQFFQLVAPCSFAVGVRLHAVVLACCVGVPSVMLGYREKCLDFMESMQLEELYLPLDAATEAEFSEKLNRLETKSPSFRQDIIDRACDWKAVQQNYIQPMISQSMP